MAGVSIDDRVARVGIGVGRDVVAGMHVSRAIRHQHHVPVLHRILVVPAQQIQVLEVAHVVVGNAVRVRGAADSALAGAARIVPACPARLEHDHEVVALVRVVDEELVLAAIAADRALRLDLDPLAAGRQRRGIGRFGGAAVTGHRCARIGNARAAVGAGVLRARVLRRSIGVRGGAGTVGGAAAGARAAAAAGCDQEHAAGQQRRATADSPRGLHQGAHGKRPTIAQQHHGPQSAIARLAKSAPSAGLMPPSRAAALGSWRDSLRIVR